MAMSIFSLETSRLDTCDAESLGSTAYIFGHPLPYTLGNPPKKKGRYACPHIY